MITVLITWDGDEEALKRTMDSLEKQKETFRSGMHLRILYRSSGAEFDPGLTDVVKRQYPAIADLVLMDAGNVREPQMLKEQIGTVETPLVSWIAAGEAYLGDAPEAAGRFLLQEKEKTDAVLLANTGRKVRAAQEGKPVLGKVYALDRPGELLKLPGCMRGMIFLTAALRETDMSCESETCFFEILACRVLLRKRTAAFVKNAYFSGSAAISDMSGLHPAWETRQWYLDVVKSYCLPMLPEDGSAPLLCQAQALFALKTVFRVNMNHKNKGILTGEQRDEYLRLCTECLQRIENCVITFSDAVNPERRLVYTQWSAFMCLKYQAESERLFIGEKDGLLYCENRQIRQEKGFAPFVTVGLMECENGCWRIDCAIERFLTEGALKLEVLVNQKAAAIRRVPRFSETGFFGTRVVDRDAFAVELPISALEAENEIVFVLTDKNGRRMTLPVAAVDYGAKITSLLRNSYWCFGPYMARMKWNGARTGGILLQRKGRAARMAQEFRFLKEILMASYGSKQMFVVRCLYWLAYPFYSGKNIWLTFDKLYKGGDCGEYFYKYLCTRREDGILPVYVIKEDAPDRFRLRQEGYEPLVYHSLKQRLFYLYARMVFATHSSVHSFCGFSKWEIRFIQDRLRCVNTCIQHGLSVQNLTFDSNRIVNNNKRYYCASRFEIENLSKPAYDYAPEVLRLTGIPRYDGLVNRDQRQILITPTWRSYIAMPAVMGSARPYNPDFVNTDYYKIFQELLENRRLVETAQKTGYRVIYLLHPIISAQKEDFRPGSGIELVSALEISYEQILTESSLMVTDYSGVQFDFAYMRKPVVYFHPPKLPPHYEEGGFFYDTQGFGEICTGVGELVDVLCEYMESGCRLKDFYRARQDDFFAYSDQENCRRIYEDARQYQRERQVTG